MVKSFNINLVIILTALINIIGTAPVWDDHALMEATEKILVKGRSVVMHRQRDVNKPFNVHSPADAGQYIGSRIAKAVSKSIPSLSPFTKHELLQEPNEFMRPSQIHFIRAYHSLVFERLKTLFLKIQHRIVEQPNSETLKTGRDCVAPYLLRHQDLERKWRNRLIELCTVTHLDRRLFGKWRKLALPAYDWEHVHNIHLPTVHQIAQDQLPIYDDATIREMLQRSQKRIQNVVAARTWIKRKGLPLNLQTDLGPTSYVITRIAQIRSNSRPFSFTEEQLLENPDASMPPVQLQLTRPVTYD
ncbi:hypothetical protein SeLEV6574_g07390 [Synchytrium endobioticum]|uniref:Uncharacterized protein n=1 Tax=Synchytrium endobioticum TaxID=286115 RepID=A0A507CLS2_9FUNG|nr:hypothetical protein SeLEV6574_g07390 [Synchytrium endobioticum]